MAVGDGESITIELLSEINAPAIPVKDDDDGAYRSPLIFVVAAAAAAAAAVVVKLLFIIIDPSRIPVVVTDVVVVAFFRPVVFSLFFLAISSFFLDCFLSFARRFWNQIFTLMI